MIFHLPIVMLTALLNTLFATLPAWTAPNDGGIINAFIQVLAALDRFLPIHDGFLPIIGISLTYSVCLLGYKFVVFILNMVRGAGA